MFSSSSSSSGQALTIKHSEWTDRFLECVHMGSKIKCGCLKDFARKHVENLRDKIKFSQLVLRAMVASSGNMFSHWAVIFKINQKIFSIEYGRTGVEIKFYITDENDFHQIFNCAYGGLMGDHEYVNCMDMIIDVSFETLLESVDRLILDKYLSVSYSVTDINCQTFVRALMRPLTSKIYELPTDIEKAALILIKGTISAAKWLSDPGPGKTFLGGIVYLTKFVLTAYFSNDENKRESVEIIKKEFICKKIMLP